MLISEIFLSIQGESTYVGIPCIFIRLAGCNLDCTWCDTPYARTPDEASEASVEEVVAEARKLKPWLVEVTGGEPLLQPETKELTKKLLDLDYRVLIETNGSVSFEGLDERLVKVVDIKCPSSGHDDVFLMSNVPLITPEDEVKFVIGDRGDYEFAKRFTAEYAGSRTEKILFAPVRPELEPRVLADWILADGLSVRLQVQMHGYIWADERQR
ncbi:MAG: radical SAM protein [Thermodesulfobacteriota bacterium]